MRILFIAGNLIGDVVLASGVLAHLCETHPGARFTIVCGRAAGRLFAAFPALEAVVPMTKAPGDGHWWALWRDLRGRGRFDLAVDLRGSLLTWFLPAGRRLIKRGAKAAHAADDLARVVGLDRSPPTRVWLNDEHRAFAAPFLADPPPAGVIALCPGASWSGKRWPPERFAALARALAGPGGSREGARVLILGGPGDEADMAAVIAGAAGLDVRDTDARTGLLEAAAILAGCDLFVGNDSGLMHLAAAAGAPTLGLFGPTDPARYAPFGARTAWVRATRDFDPSAPDHPTSKSHPEATGLMDTLSTEAALAAALALLDRSSDRCAQSSI